MTRRWNTTHAWSACWLAVGLTAAVVAVPATGQANSPSTHSTNAAKRFPPRYGRPAPAGYHQLPPPVESAETWEAVSDSSDPENIAAGDHPALGGGRGSPDPARFAGDWGESPGWYPDGDQDFSYAGPGRSGVLDCLLARTWGSVEYLLWWERAGDLPPLVTTSPRGTDQEDAGVLGLDTTRFLFGGQSVEDNPLAGGRLTVGTWLAGWPNVGVGGRFFAIEDRSIDFARDFATTSILARPFFDVQSNDENTLLIAFPGLTQGDVRVAYESDVNGAEAFFRLPFRFGCNYRVDWVYGYRYFKLDEALAIDNQFEFLISSPPADPGTVIRNHDLFDMDNDFHGGELGLMGHSMDGCWSLDFLIKVALGNTRQLVQISGQTVTTPPDSDPFTSAGGLLTQSSNIGEFVRDEFAVLPEATLTLGYHITPCLDLSVGYTFLYISNVVRADQVIDRSVNLSQQTGELDGEARPVFRFQDTDYWLQGINFGLHWRY